MATIEIIPESIQLIRMSDEEYFSDKYKDYISNSKLGMINPEEEGSLEKFLSGFKQDYSPSFELGSALHASVLQPDSYYISKFRKPGGKLGIFIEKLFEFRKKDANIKIYEAINRASLEADYYAGKLSGVRLKTALKTGLPYYLYLWHHEAAEIASNYPKEPIYLSESIYDKHKSCIANLIKNKEITDLLPSASDLLFEKDVFNEYAIFCELYVTVGSDKVKLKFKGKLDNFTVDNHNKLVVLNDLKTSSKPASFFMGNNVKIKEGTRDKWVWYDGSFQKYRYYRQMGLYAWLLQCYLKKEGIEGYKFKVNMIVVETVPEYGNAIYPVVNKYIKKGLKEANKLLTLVAEWKLNSKM